MPIVILILQVLVALTLLNVWVLRPGKKTPFRGGGASDMRGEFHAYGLPDWAMYAVGTLKIAIAIALLIGIWVPILVRPAAVLLAVLMLGAFIMHLKIKDPPHRGIPSIVMFVLAVLIALLPSI